MDMSLCKELVDLELERSTLKLRLDEIEERQGEIKGVLLPQFGEAGSSAIAVNGRVIELKGNWRASPTTGVPLVEAMKASGLGYMLSTGVHPQRMESWISDLAGSIEGLPSPEAVHSLLPAPLQSILKLYYLHHLKVMKRSKV